MSSEKVYFCKIDENLNTQILSKRRLPGKRYLQFTSNLDCDGEIQTDYRKMSQKNGNLLTFLLFMNLKFHIIILIIIIFIIILIIFFGSLRLNNHKNIIFLQNRTDGLYKMCVRAA